MSNRTDILILTGEYSGNLYGAELAGVLLEEDPSLRLMGTGCSQMAEAGVSLLADCSSWGGIGPIEILKRLDLYFFLDRIQHLLEKERPRLVILIDFPFFNMRVARMAKRLGIPTLYYFPPGKFSKKPEEVRDAAQTCTRIAAPFRFTYDNYRAAAANVEYVGHPLFDILPRNPDREGLRRRLGVPDGGKLVALLPGSRIQEVKAHTPILYRCARELARGDASMRFCCPLPDLRHAGTSTRIRSTVERWFDTPSLSIPILHGKAAEVMASADLLLISSGTATLEAAFYRTPMVIVYQASWLTEFLAGFVYGHFPEFFTLPNMISERQIVPEFIQERFDQTNVCSVARDILENPERAAIMRKDLARLADMLGMGTPGATRRVAFMAFELIGHSVA